MLDGFRAHLGGATGWDRGVWLCRTMYVEFHGGGYFLRWGDGTVPSPRGSIFCGEFEHVGRDVGKALNVRARGASYVITATCVSNVMNTTYTLHIVDTALFVIDKTYSCTPHKVNTTRREQE